MKITKFQIGLFITIFYFAVILVGFFSQIIKLNGLTLNELGDFLAGVFGPVAFLWLVLGYIQQGEELKLNTEALKLQVDELSQTVEQQKELVNLTRKQFENSLVRQRRLDISTLPKFTWSGGGLSSTNTEIACAFQFKNSGGIATDLSFESSSPYLTVSPEHLNSISNGVSQRVKFTISKDVMSTFTSNIGEELVEIMVRYISLEGEACNKLFFVPIRMVSQGQLTCGEVIDEEPEVRDSQI